MDFPNYKNDKWIYLKLEFSTNFCCNLSMTIAQDRSKHYADKKISILEFEIGDKVFLKCHTS